MDKDVQDSNEGSCLYYPLFMKDLLEIGEKQDDKKVSRQEKENGYANTL